MGMIRDLEPDYSGYLQGIFDSDSIFKCEMNVFIDAENGATEEDAETCIAHYNDLKNRKDILDAIEEGLTKYFLFMCDKLSMMEEEYGDDYPEVMADLDRVKEGYREGRSLTEFLSEPSLYAYKPRNGEIGYGIEGSSLWDPDYSCMIIIRNNTVLFVGVTGGLTPWEEEDEYWCPWDEE